MPYDLYMSVAIVIAALAIPSALAAWVDNRTPRLSALLIVAGGGLMVWTARTKPGGYTLEEIPGVFITVIGHYW